MNHNLALLKTLTIMLIEDEVIVRQQMEAMLSIFFAQVLSCASGIDALKVLTKSSPDIIVTDIKMPALDGLSLTQKIRQTSDVPIVLITCLSDKETLLKSINLGVDGYLVKPIELDPLLSLFCNIIERRKNIRKVYSFSNGLTFDLRTEELTNRGAPIELGQKERKLLIFFLNNANSVQSKEKIMAHIWGYEVVSDSAFKNLLARLRSKVGEDLIMSIKGSGWILKS